MNLDPEDEPIPTNISPATSLPPTSSSITDQESINQPSGGQPDRSPSEDFYSSNTLFPGDDNGDAETAIIAEDSLIPAIQDNANGQKHTTAIGEAGLYFRYQPNRTPQGYPYSHWPSELPDIASVEVDEKNKPSGWTVAKAVIREIVETVVLTLVIFFLIQLVIRNFRVDGHSMDPNLHHGQYLVVDKISYNLPLLWRPPVRGDVVVFEPPTHPDKDFVKRIIGLPGETIEIRQGEIYINATLFEEPYEAFVGRFTMGPQVVPDGHYFVMGDNRPNSNDSRNWGPLPEEKIVGKVWLSYWPPETWGVIPNNGPTDAGTLFNAIQSVFQ